MIGFAVNSILLGVALAMDAFSVSIANGLNEPRMPNGRKCLIAGVYAFFQFLMPMVGWFCVHTVVKQFQAFEAFIPWIALILLLYIGGKMLRDGIRQMKSGGGAGDEAADPKRQTSLCAETDRNQAEGAVLTMGVLLLQGIATSIDALSVGFAIAGYSGWAAFACAVIIAAVTFLICMGGLAAGQKLGEKLNGKGEILGGCILIFIGLEIFVRGVIL